MLGYQGNAGHVLTVFEITYYIEDEFHAFFQLCKCMYDDIRQQYLPKD